MKTKLDYPGNPQANVTIEIIHQVLGNIVRTYILQETYVYYDLPWMGILAAASFAVCSTYHSFKGKNRLFIRFSLNINYAFVLKHTTWRCR